MLKRFICKRSSSRDIYFAYLGMTRLAKRTILGQRKIFGDRKCEDR